MTNAIAQRRTEDLPDLLTREELSAYTGISVQTLARWVGEGKGPRPTKLGRAVRYDKTHVLAWIERAAQ